MSIGPMGMIGSAAGSPLAQGQGSDVNRAQQDTADHAATGSRPKRPKTLRASGRPNRTKRRRIAMPTVDAPGRSRRRRRARAGRARRRRAPRSKDPTGPEGRAAGSERLTPSAADRTVPLTACAPSRKSNTSPVKTVGDISDGHTSLLPWCGTAIASVCREESHAIHQDARGGQRLHLRRLLCRAAARRPRQPGRRISDRRFGVGGDGLILIRPFGRGRRADADVQRRRLRSRDVRQRHPLRGQVRLRSRPLPAGDAADRNGGRRAGSGAGSATQGQVERVRVDMGRPDSRGPEDPHHACRAIRWSTSRW